MKWDKKEGDFIHFMSLLNKKDDILDVGANIGIMTAHLGKAFPNQTIHAIEPMPENLVVLKNIIDKKNLKNVQVVPFAVGDAPGQLQMVMPVDGKAKLQGLSHIKTPEIEDWNEGEEFEVEVKTLDELFANTKIQGIKMDVENYEYRALKGGERILTENRPIVYTELWDNENRTNCFEFMQKLNFSIQVLVNGKLVNFDKKIHKHQNFFFIPN